MGTEFICEKKTLQARGFVLLTCLRALHNSEPKQTTLNNPGEIEAAAKVYASS